MGLWSAFKTLCCSVATVGKAAVTGLVEIGKGVGKVVFETLKAVGELIILIASAPEELLGRPDEIVDAAEQMHGIIPNKFFHFAFAGHAKVGKSTLINALRGIQNDELGAAESNETECTMRVTKYDWKELPYVKLVDIPGCGTPNFKSKNYFKENGLGAFDFMTILIESTTTTEQIALAKNCRQINQPVCFVRSKLDVDLYSAIKVQSAYKGETQENATHLMNKIKTALVAAKDKEGLSDVPLFCISANSMLWLMRDPTQLDIVYEEKELFQYMKQQIAKNRRRR